jgi:hypothetical protein
MMARAIAASIISPDTEVQNTEVRKTAENPELAQRKAGNACMVVRVARKPESKPSTIQVKEAVFIFFFLPDIKSTYKFLSKIVPSSAKYYRL